MNYNHNNEQHREHPVRNVFFCIYCFFFSIAFSYLWIWKLFTFEYSYLALLVAILILVGAIVGGILSFTKSHSNYFANRRYYKNNRYR